MSKKFWIKSMLAVSATALLSACGGGGGGGSPQIISYPYETVYGDVCATFQPTPGCTFSSITGGRIDLSHDPDYNQTGWGSDDMWWVYFDSTGVAAVYDQFSNFQYYADVSEFAGWVAGTTIGVGTTGLFWENIAGGTYWLGRNGVLYSANLFNSNYGQAVNEQGAGSASQTSFAALNSEANKKLIQRGAEGLVKNYGFSKDKASAVASALNSWALAAVERGSTTPKDIDRTFKSVFGVNYQDALAAVKDLKAGNTEGMAELTNRSAAALGLKPEQAQKFIKGMYKKALANWGYDSNSIKW